MKKSLLILALGVVGASANATVFVFSGGPVTITSGVATMNNFNVVGLDGAIVDVNLRMIGISHTWPDDIGAVLANNAGANTILFDGPGGSTDIVGLSWQFDDSGATPLPNADPLVSGIFKPGQNEWNDPFTNITGPYGTTMAGLNGGSNGTWVLHVEDFVTGDNGTIQETSLIITTAVPEPATMTALALGAVAFIRRRRK